MTAATMIEPGAKAGTARSRSAMKWMTGTAAAIAALGLNTAAPALAQYRQQVRNDPARCAAGAGPAVQVTVTGIKASSGLIRVQSYRGTASEWLKKGHWLARIEAPARRGTMSFCMPVPAAGTYAIAVRHDSNANGETDIMSDGGGMSNNPSINILNLGRPSVDRTAITVGNTVRTIQINMRYM
jgi:uncharacterized protein (DUF2141 family)